MTVIRTGLVFLLFVLFLNNFVQGLDLNSESLSNLLKKASKSNKPLVLVVDDNRSTGSSSSSGSAEHRSQRGSLKKQSYHHQDRNVQSRHHQPHENKNYHSNSDYYHYKSKHDYQPKRQYNKVSYNRHYHDKGLSRGGEQAYHDHHRDHRSAQHGSHEDHDSSHEVSSRGHQSNKLERLYKSFKQNRKGKTHRYRNKDINSHLSDSHEYEKGRKFRPFRSEKYHHDRKDKHHGSEIYHRKDSREDVPRHHRNDESYSREYEPRERHHLSKQERRREQRRERQRQIALELREYEGLQGNDPRHGLRSGVVKSLLRISNDLMCDAKDECQDDCDDKGKGDDCGNACEEKFDCDGGGEKKTEECAKSDNFCGDEDAVEGNPSTRGVLLEPEEDTGCKRC